MTIVQVYSRSQNTAEALAGKLHARPTSNLSSLIKGAHLYIVSVSDDALAEVRAEMDCCEKFVVHTSGSISMDVFKSFADNYGVLYPLQTFSKNRKLDFSHIPMCIEANVRTIASEQRKIIHLAAVFACNFPNFMYSIAEKIMRNANLDFNLLKPLIIETAEKVRSVSPDMAQTGPALRGDHTVMDKHMDILADDKQLQALYKQISQEISRLKKDAESE